MKIKIIVEGKSDEIFLKALIQKYKLRGINIEISGGSNKQEIMKHKTIKKIIENAKEDGYEKIIILIDKVTQFNYKMINSSCVLDIKKAYENKVLLGLNANVVVVDEEIECWYLLGENIKNYYQKCHSEVKKIFKSTAKQQLAQKAVKKLDVILKNRSKNKSFDYFLTKIGL